MKYLVMIAAGGLAFYAIERFAVQNDKFLGLDFPEDTSGNAKLSAGYFAVGGAVVVGACLAGWALHKVSGGRLAKGVAPAGK